jgi:hypothetical protein
MRVNSKNFRVSAQVWNKREFDATNQEDLREYQYFIDNQNWKDGCPFILEWPYLNVVDMIQNKIIDQYLSGIISEAQ